MATKSVLITILLFASTVSAQSLDYYRWEAVTKGGNIVYGMEKSKEAVLQTIKYFNIRNENTNNILILHNIKKSKTLNKNLLTEFYSRNERKYRVLSRAEFMALHINEINSFDSAVRYYKKSKEIELSDSAEHLKTLIQESNTCMMKSVRQNY